jgi:predicted enzyme related to lactoylglutathione lyase
MQICIITIRWAREEESQKKGIVGYPIVFFDIAGSDSKALASFYFRVFGWELDQAGNFSVSVVSPLPGTLRQDPAEKRIYIGVPDIDASLTLVKEHGGAIDAPRFEVPGVVVLGLFKDPAGNPMGLVEMEGNVRRIP